MPSLRELQDAFFRGISGGDASAALLGEIRGDSRLGPGERLGVYARMYLVRLIDVLREDFPRVAAVLGSETFTAMARRYVAAHPSTHPSLRWFGRDFPTLLARAAAEDPLPAYVPDLARLEWARLEVFDAADAELLGVEALRRVPPESWATLRLELVPAVTLLESAWPVHRIWEASAEGGGAAWHPEATHLRVWRHDARVYQASMDRTERVALAHVQAGDDFAALCAGVATIVEPEAAAATAGAMMLRWIEDGVLAGSAAVR
jgi:hypothetical protein